ncbi:unnamed protein product [Vicia faba]|uniref:Uncharacterized protein n=1 Tax=Vicia faba TaxID=3906 RepID=A0AAV0Z9H6_VICFA|nr:unnamed protein product [Vicia faba]
MNFGYATIIFEKLLYYILSGYVFLLIPLPLYSGYVFQSSHLPLSSYSYFVCVLNRSYNRHTVSPSTNYPCLFQTLTPKTITSTTVSSSPIKRKRKVSDSAPLEEEYKQWVKDAKALKLDEMNRKNRVDNFKNASELRPTKTGLKEGDTGYDPFSRMWTILRNYYVAKPGVAQREVEDGVDLSEENPCFVCKLDVFNTDFEVITS